jgi:hypothetical protein
MIQPKLLHDYLQSDDAYNKLFDNMVKEETDWMEERFNHHATNPTEKELQDTKKLVEKLSEDKGNTNEDLKTEHHRLMKFGGIIAAMSIQKAWEEKRAKTIKKWKEEAQAKNKRILKATPFDNIRCKKCNSLMDYQWSDLHEETVGSISKVLFFYQCPKQCTNQLIFEDGKSRLSHAYKSP